MRFPFSIQSRLLTMFNVRTYLSDLTTPTCFSHDNTRLLDTKIIKQFGDTTSNVQGDVYLTCIERYDECEPKIVIKLITSETYQPEYEFVNMYDLPDPDMIEVSAMKITTDLVQKHYCQNLPLLYTHTFCPDCKSTNCITLVSEYANIGDLDKFIRNKFVDNDILMNILFQTCCGLATIWNNYGMIHNDLHSGNVLLHTTTLDQGVWEYIINGDSYFCPNIGIMVMLWDFGFSIVPGMIAPRISYVNDMKNKGFFNGDRNIYTSDLRKLLDSVVYTLVKVNKRKLTNFPDIFDVWTIFQSPMFYDINIFTRWLFRKYLKHNHLLPVIDTFITDDYQTIPFYSKTDYSKIISLLDKLSPLMISSFIVHNKSLSYEQIKSLGNLVDPTLLLRISTDISTTKQIIKDYNVENPLNWVSVSPVASQLIMEYNKPEEFNWKFISYFTDLTDGKLIDMFPEYIDWNIVSQKHNIPTNTYFLMKFSDKIVWKYITIEFLEMVDLDIAETVNQLKDLLDWKIMSVSNYEVLSTFPQYVNWYLVNINKIQYSLISANLLYIDRLWLSENASDKLILALYNDYPDYLVWSVLKPKMLKTINLLEDHLNWKLISQYVPIRHIPGYKKYIDWDSLQRYNKLDSPTIIKYFEMLSPLVLETQEVNDIVLEMFNKLDLVDFQKLNILGLSKDKVYEYSDKINWNLKTSIMFFDKYPNILIKFLKEECPIIIKLDKKLLTETLHPTGDTLFICHSLFDRNLFKNFKNIRYNDYYRLGWWFNWDLVAQYGNLTSSQIRMYKHSLNLKLVHFTEFDWIFFRAHKDEINWKDVAALNPTDQLFIKEFAEYILPHIIHD